MFPKKKKGKKNLINLFYLRKINSILFSIVRSEQILEILTYRVLRPSSAEKKNFFSKPFTTQVLDIVQNYILVSGIEQRFLYRLV